MNLHIAAKMENFYIRTKNVEIDCACLEKERQELKAKNEELKENLRQYLQEMSITNGRVGSTKERLRPQSMKIGRINCTDIKTPLCKVSQTRRPVTGVEANLSVAVRSHSLVQNRIKTASIYSVVN